jgi:transglutaminase-like putative cysteine protease
LTVLLQATAGEMVVAKARSALSSLDLRGFLPLNTGAHAYSHYLSSAINNSLSLKAQLHRSLMEISVGCRLRYDVPMSTYCVLKVEAANSATQTVRRETLQLPSGACGSNDSFVEPVTRNRIKRIWLGAGSVEVVYEADVEVDDTGVDPDSVVEFDFGNLPMDCLPFLAPSRYCPSDTFTEFAFDVFGQRPRGYSRVAAISDWIYSNIVYEQGASGPFTDAGQVFGAGSGVCRDFAHLGIAMTRAIGVPARYASAYADQLQPQDFHALFEAYLLGPNGGRWFTFDPTRMSSPHATVRIAAGRDAADVAFAWPQGEVESSAPEVWVNAKGRSDSTISSLAVTD